MRARSMIACLLLCGAGSAAAAPAVEQVVAITESVGYEIDAAERDLYGLFPERQGFVLAEVVTRDGSYWLRTTYRRGPDRLVERIALSGADLQALRRRIEARDEEIRSGARRETATPAQTEGRLRLVTDAFLYGLWLYGPGTILLLDLEDGAATGVELLVAGGAFAGALTVTEDHHLGYGRSKLVRWGSYAGTFYGLAIPALFESDSRRVHVASAMAVTPAGGYLAHRLTRRRWFRKGEADLIANGGWVGALYGLAIPYLAGVDPDGSSAARLYLAAAMAGVPAGVKVTTRLVRDRPINRGRAHLITLGGVLGAAYALTAVDLVDDREHPRAYVAAAMLGLPAGAGLGHRLTGRQDYPLSRARMITVGTYAGAIAGAGLLLSFGIDDDRALNIAGVAGSAAGLWFTHRATQGWGGAVRFPPAGQGIRVSLPTPATLLALGTLARRGARGPLSPLELVRVSF